MGTVRSGSTEGLAPYRSALDHVPCVPLACPKFARSAQPILLSSVAFKSRSSMLLGKRKARRTNVGAFCEAVICQAARVLLASGPVGIREPL
jgi:hypothetical protein